MLTRRGFLGTSLALGGGLLTRTSTGGGVALAPPKRLVVVMAAGGWDTAYALDPKEPQDVDIPAGGVQRFGNLDVFCDASRPNVTAYFERHGARTAIVRGIQTNSIVHVDCERRMLTGTRLETNPDIAAIVAHDCGNDLPLPYLVLGQIAFTGPYAAGSGRVGMHNQLAQLLGSTGAGGRGVRDLPIPRDPLRHDAELSEAEAAAMHRYHEAIVERERATRGANGYNQKRLADFLEGSRRGTRLKSLRSRFGTTGATLDYPAQLALAVDAIAQDVSQAVMVTTGFEWDTHGENYRQGTFHDDLFAGLIALVDELAARPGRTAGSKMIDDTIVAVVSEFTRTPKLASRAEDAGKNHWPIGAAMVIGGGARGDIAIGGTTRTVDAEPIDLQTGAISATGVPLTPALFVGAVLDLCGADATAHLELPAPLVALRT